MPLRIEYNLVLVDLSMFVALESEEKGEPTHLRTMK